MWSIATEKIQSNPNEGQTSGGPNAISAAFEVSAFPTRWFWSEELHAWTRNVSKRTYYNTKKNAELAVVLVAGQHPELLGCIMILAASDIAIENAMAPKRKEMPF
jgi:hypothetical protein